MLASLRITARFALIVAFATMLAACKSDLYSNMLERDANEIIGVLAENGIEASRERTKEGTFTVSVPRESAAQSIDILTKRGLPRQKFDNLGTVFDNKRIVSTPVEERARFMFALNQELANSISQIKGVVSARVHVMMPDVSPLDREKQQPRASVFIYHQPDADITQYIGVIKTLVTNAVAGLNYEDVAVALFPASTPLLQRGAGSAFGGSTIMGFALSNVVALAFIFLLLVIAVLVMRRRAKETNALFSRR